MPVISFDIGELTKEQKEVLAKEFGESASRVTGLPIEMIYVLFNERKFDNVSVGGVLLSNQE
ncbi:MAG: tautomerase family protein [Methanobrevibacter sp.]|uniref:tautomerase family protein n=1 Tax=Methanobrevibacter sp. TaxID=66852 RepID=UPI002E76F479|nr:tautomerase family protein [Methanobrevibacter sp.]MEE0935504.1 tautomerase family protein [Methanobrevibacter sp.]